MGTTTTTRPAAPPGPGWPLAAPPPGKVWAESSQCLSPSVRADVQCHRLLMMECHYPAAHIKYLVGSLRCYHNAKLAHYHLPDPLRGWTWRTWWDLRMFCNTAKYCKDNCKSWFYSEDYFRFRTFTKYCIFDQFFNYFTSDCVPQTFPPTLNCYSTDELVFTMDL